MVQVPVGTMDLVKNNQHILKARKKSFKSHLIKSFETTGFLFIILLYLQNISFLRFTIRLLLHTLIASPFPTDYRIQANETFKKQITKTLFYTILVINPLFLIIDLIIGVPSINDDDVDTFYGSLTLQIIGNSKPTTRVSYLYFNVIIFGIQYILLYLTCLIAIDKELENSVITQDSEYSINQIEGDGYTGQVNVTRILPIRMFQEIKRYNITSDVDTSSYNDYMGDRLNISSMI